MDKDKDKDKDKDTDKNMAATLWPSFIAMYHYGLGVAEIVIYSLIPPSNMELDMWKNGVGHAKSDVFIHTVL